METHTKEEIWKELLENESYWSIGFTNENLKVIKDIVFDHKEVWNDISLVFPNGILFENLSIFDYYTYSIIYTHLCNTILEELNSRKMLVFN